TALGIIENVANGHAEPSGPRPVKVGLERGGGVGRPDGNPVRIDARTLQPEIADFAFQAEDESTQVPIVTQGPATEEPAGVERIGSASEIVEEACRGVDGLGRIGLAPTVSGEQSNVGPGPREDRHWRNGRRSL